MEIVIGCLLSFLCGVVCTLAVQVVDVKKGSVRGGPSGTPVPTDDMKGSRREEQLREQWESFLNYNGKEQMGGDE